MEFKNIGFIGLGLIGGSIAKKIKADLPVCDIIATDNNKETLEKAYSEAVISNSRPLSLDDFSQCDLIYLCAPAEQNISYLSQLKNIIKNDCIITDVGSTKTKIHEEIIRLNMEHNFIGGHPMTGSEKSGFSNAHALLLENAYYIITPTKEITDDTIQQFYSFIKILGALPLVMDYKKHDYATATISHLPHMIAYTLVNLVREIDDEQETMKTIAAGGFKDLTRIASSSPVMWENICSTNKEFITLLMERYIEAFTELKSEISNTNASVLIEKFQNAKDYRDSIAVPGIKSYHPVYELYLDLADEAGGIAIVSSLLAFKGINIKNIGIIHNREFEEGVLRIEFYDSRAEQLAKEILEDKNYIIHKR